jgi:hypothetical protein
MQLSVTPTNAPSTDATSGGLSFQRGLALLLLLLLLLTPPLLSLLG